MASARCGGGSVLPGRSGGRRGGAGRPRLPVETVLPGRAILPCRTRGAGRPLLPVEAVLPGRPVLPIEAIAARRAWPATLAAATIGRGGERELVRHGVAGVIAPAQFDSEGLLAMPAMQAVAGKRVVIFRGDGGRELLGETLRARGALVDYAACYRRALPQGNAASLLAAWRDGRVDAVTATSSEGLRNLFTLLGEGGREMLGRTPVFVPHPRIEGVARAAGCQNVVLTAQGDDGLLAGLHAWFGR